jgi:F-box protein 11
LSYTHDDDANDDGLITGFRRRFEGELRAQIGRRDLQIFQDRDDVAWGQAWKDRVDDSLDAATFFIPVLHPRRHPGVPGQ